MWQSDRLNVMCGEWAWLLLGIARVAEVRQLTIRVERMKEWLRQMAKKLLKGALKKLEVGHKHRDR